MSSVDDDSASTPGGLGQKERRKIEIKFIENKTRRHVTFSKRKHGIMKKAFELSVLTGTQVLLLVVSETGLVYTFSTPKFEPIVTQQEGRNLIQACLNAPDEEGEEEEEEEEEEGNNTMQHNPEQEQQQPMFQQENRPNSSIEDSNSEFHGQAPGARGPEIKHDDPNATHIQFQQQQQQQQQGKIPNQYNQAHYLNEEQTAVYQQYFQDQQAHYS